MHKLLCLSLLLSCALAFASAATLPATKFSWCAVAKLTKKPNISADMELAYNQCNTNDECGLEYSCCPTDTGNRCFRSNSC